MCIRERKELQRAHTRAHADKHTALYLAEGPRGVELNITGDLLSDIVVHERQHGVGGRALLPAGVRLDVDGIDNGGGRENNLANLWWWGRGK